MAVVLTETFSVWLLSQIKTNADKIFKEVVLAIKAVEQAWNEKERKRKRVAIYLLASLASTPIAQQSRVTERAEARWATRVLLDQKRVPRKLLTMMRAMRVLSESMAETIWSAIVPLWVAAAAGEAAAARAVWLKVYRQYISQNPKGATEGDTRSAHEGNTRSAHEEQQGGELCGESELSIARETISEWIGVWRALPELNPCRFNTYKLTRTSGLEECREALRDALGWFGARSHRVPNDSHGSKTTWCPHRGDTRELVGHNRSDLGVDSYLGAPGERNNVVTLCCRENLEILLLDMTGYTVAGAHGTDCAVLSVVKGLSGAGFMYSRERQAFGGMLCQCVTWRWSTLNVNFLVAGGQRKTEKLYKYIREAHGHAGFIGYIHGVVDIMRRGQYDSYHPGQCDMTKLKPRTGFGRKWTGLEKEPKLVDQAKLLSVPVWREVAPNYDGPEWCSMLLYTMAAGDELFFSVNTGSPEDVLVSRINMAVVGCTQSFGLEEKKRAVFLSSCSVINSCYEGRCELAPGVHVTMDRAKTRLIMSAGCRVAEVELDRFCSNVALGTALLVPTHKHGSMAEITLDGCNPMLWYIYAAAVGGAYACVRNGVLPLVMMVGDQGIGQVLRILKGSVAVTRMLKDGLQSCSTIDILESSTVNMRTGTCANAVEKQKVTSLMPPELLPRLCETFSVDEALTFNSDSVARLVGAYESMALAVGRRPKMFLHVGGRNSHSLTEIMKRSWLSVDDRGIFTGDKRGGADRLWLKVAEAMARVLHDQYKRGSVGSWLLLVLHGYHAGLSETYGGMPVMSAGLKAGRVMAGICQSGLKLQDVLKIPLVIEKDECTGRFVSFTEATSITQTGSSEERHPRQFWSAHVCFNGNKSHVSWTNDRGVASCRAIMDDPEACAMERPNERRVVRSNDAQGSVLQKCSAGCLSIVVAWVPVGCTAVGVNPSVPFSKDQLPKNKEPYVGVPPVGTTKCQLVSYVDSMERAKLEPLVQEAGSCLHCCVQQVRGKDLGYVLDPSSD